ncbi:hypothetical protein GCM10017788_37830 [Amycolatopsis acidiphila]|nr:hypothetical protein GCM10017788_37830 [Amycolatopsis acidiphila]
MAAIVFSEPQKPTSRPPPDSVTTTWPGQVAGRLPVTGLVEPDPVCVDDVLRRIELPHRTVRRDAPDGRDRTPEPHAGPERPHLGVHQADVEVPDAVEGVAAVTTTPAAFVGTPMVSVLFPGLGYFAGEPLRCPVVGGGPTT